MDTWFWVLVTSFLWVPAAILALMFVFMIIFGCVIMLLEFQDNRRRDRSQ